MSVPQPATPADMDNEQFEDGLRMTPNERVRAALDLYDLCRATCLAGIQMQHPGADDNAIARIYEQRLLLGRQLDCERLASP